jgi:lysophospholipase L1-like esterase
MSTKRLSWRGKLLLAVLSPFVAFGAIEVGLRIVGFRYEPWNEYLWGRTCDELRQTELYRADPELLWTCRPSSVLNLPAFGFLDVHTNSLGLRGPEIPRTRKPGEFRVLCLGESVTFGCGLRDGETWPERMEESLRAAPALKGRPVRVVNAAVPGWSSVQGMRLFDHLAFVRPDVVVFWFGFADAHEMRGVPDSAQRYPAGGVPLALRPLWRLRSFQLVEKAVTAARAATVEGTRVSEEEFRANVGRLRKLEARGGPKVIFVHEPECVAVTIGQLRRVVARAREMQVQTVIGPRQLLSWVIPAPPGADLTGSPWPFRGRPAIRFAPLPGVVGYSESDQVMEIGALRSDLEMLEELKRNFDRLLSNLPADSLTYEDFFGDRRPDEVFIDNCHLSVLGARLVGAKMAATALPPTTDER